ncbi:MAG TPA: DsrE family protein [Nitrospira sp.]|nr:DsrE family protein [Nitrospira sp.]
MWNRIVPAACLVAIVMVVPSVQAEGFSDKGGADRSHRVVMHLNSGDGKMQKGTLNNIRHLYQELGREQLQLELVVHGAGLSLFTKNATALGQELAILKADYGVHYTACSNTMKAMKITRDDLIGEVEDTVPAMVRLMERQEQGWVYIKP